MPFVISDNYNPPSSLPTHHATGFLENFLCPLPSVWENRSLPNFYT